MFGGGGGPDRGASGVVPAGYPMQWVTGGDDVAANSSEGYDALADARGGLQTYQAAGAGVSMLTPSGVDHEGVIAHMGPALKDFLRAHITRV